MHSPRIAATYVGATATITAMITPTVLAHTAPERTPNPASRMINPSAMWIHPQADVLKWNT